MTKDELNKYYDRQSKLPKKKIDESMGEEQGLESQWVLPGAKALGQVAENVSEKIFDAGMDAGNQFVEFSQKNYKRRKQEAFNQEDEYKDILEKTMKKEGL